MSIHIEAKAGDIAPMVLITGDPLRAKHHSERWLDAPVCFNRIRGMYGYTGTYGGQPISMMGTGIGIPSTALYLHELISSYHVKTIIRVGTCGAIQKDLSLGQVIVATAAQTDSAAVKHYWQNPDRDPGPDSQLVDRVLEEAKRLHVSVKSGAIFSTDLFYSEDPGRYDDAMQKGLVGVDMETAMVYAMAAHFKIHSLSLLTVSDNILTNESLSPLDREQQTTDMMKLALGCLTTQGPAQ